MCWLHLTLEEFPLISLPTITPEHLFDCSPAREKEKVLAYPPLAPNTSEIRVLEVTIDSSTSLSSYKLKIISLDELPRLHFIALSYVWGEPGHSHHISVDCHDVAVTRNLYETLSWYQNWLPELPIWVDALCINQVDLDEKVDQIGLMSRIYKEATRVICWLGNDSSTAIEQYLK